MTGPQVSVITIRTAHRHIREIPHHLVVPDGVTRDGFHSDQFSAP